MAAPGIQFNTAISFDLFHPSIREYMQGVEKAAASGDLAGAQAAFASLSKAAQTLTALPQGQAGIPHSLLQKAIEATGAALQEGDVAEAGTILARLRQAAQDSSGASQDPGQNAEGSPFPSVEQVAPGSDQNPSEESASPNLNIEA
ncbi:MAG: hypothetical protein WAL71_15730 [Terriglobales bacterium]|jgi:hypothetical protein